MTDTIRVWGGNRPDGSYRGDVFRTLAQLEARWDWRWLHPELRRRLWRLCIDHPAIGFLSGARSQAQQAELYRVRNGVGVAPPGLSFHEDGSYPDPAASLTWAVAADMIGDLDELGRVGALYGLLDFSDVNAEPWHVQPLELPRARRDFDPAKHRLVTWHLPGDPIITEPTEDDDMNKLAARVRLLHTSNVFLIGHGGPALNLDPALNEYYREREVPYLEVPYHDQLAMSLTRQALLTGTSFAIPGVGLAAPGLVPGPATAVGE